MNFLTYSLCVMRLVAGQHRSKGIVIPIIATVVICGALAGVNYDNFILLILVFSMLMAQLLIFEINNCKPNMYWILPLTPVKKTVYWLLFCLAVAPVFFIAESLFLCAMSAFMGFITLLSVGSFGGGLIYINLFLSSARSMDGYAVLHLFALAAAMAGALQLYVYARQTRHGAMAAAILSAAVLCAEILLLVFGVVSAPAGLESEIIGLNTCLKFIKGAWWWLSAYLLFGAAMMLSAVILQINRAKRHTY